MVRSSEPGRVVPASEGGAMKEIGFWLGVRAAVLIAAGLYGSLAHAGDEVLRARDARLADVIALQGNAAVRAIRADARLAARQQPRMVFATGVGGQVSLAKERDVAGMKSGYAASPDFVRATGAAKTVGASG